MPNDYIMIILRIMKAFSHFYHLFKVSLSLNILFSQFFKNIMYLSIKIYVPINIFLPDDHKEKKIII